MIKHIDKFIEQHSNYYCSLKHLLMDVAIGLSIVAIATLFSYMIVGLVA